LSKNILVHAKILHIVIYKTTQNDRLISKLVFIKINHISSYFRKNGMFCILNPLIYVVFT